MFVVSAAAQPNLDPPFVDGSTESSLCPMRLSQEQGVGLSLQWKDIRLLLDRTGVAGATELTLHLLSSPNSAPGMDWQPALF